MRRAKVDEEEEEANLLQLTLRTSLLATMRAVGQRWSSTATRGDGAAVSSATPRTSAPGGRGKPPNQRALAACNDATTRSAGLLAHRSMKSKLPTARAES